LRPQGHVIASAGLGAIFWARSRDWRTMLISLVFGVLVDLDHFIDYWYSEGRVCFDLETFMRTRYFKKRGRIFVLFHAWEYLPLLYFVWQAMKGRKWAVAATSAMATHVVADHFANDLRPLGYFLWWRIKHGFRASVIIDWQRADAIDARHAEYDERAKRGEVRLPERFLSLFV
jgi:hypothetical protein